MSRIYEGLGGGFTPNNPHLPRPVVLPRSFTGLTGLGGAGAQLPPREGFLSLHVFTSFT